MFFVGDRLDCNGHLKEIGGRSALAELLAAVPSSANIEHHCWIVRDCALRRKLIQFAYDMSQAAYEKAPADELVQAAEQRLLQIGSGRDEHDWRPLAEISSETVNYVDRRSRGRDDLVGIPTGYQSLDELLGGWQRSDLIILAARTSHGKTAFALGTALAGAENGYHVGFGSLEMSRRQLGLRLHGMGAPIDVHVLKIGTLSHQGWHLFANTAQCLSALPFWIDDSSVLTVGQLSARAHQLKAKHGLDLLVVDYLQLLQVHHAETR